MMVKYYGKYETLEGFFDIAAMRDVGELKPIVGETILNIGPGKKEIYGTIPLGKPEWNADFDRIPFGDGFVDGIHTYYFLEYVKDPIAILREFQRVLRIGGLVNIAVPYYSSQFAYHDISYVNRFCETTWKHIFENPYYDRCEGEWLFEVNFNVIIGVIERNLILLTQLEKVEL